MGVSQLARAKVERFHRREVVASTGGGMETLETAKAVEARSTNAGKSRSCKMHAGTRMWVEQRFLLVIGIRNKKEDHKTHRGRKDRKSKDNVEA